MTANLLNGLSLACVGDSVIELYVRKRLVSECQADVKKLNLLADKYTCAASQASVAEKIFALLDDSERMFYLRGRNSKPSRHPSSVTMEEYLRATALEAIFGYLYLSQREERLDFLLSQFFLSIKEQ